jgi:hypothetical protein
MMPTFKLLPGKTAADSTMLLIGSSIAGLLFRIQNGTQQNTLLLLSHAVL